MLQHFFRNPMSPLPRPGSCGRLMFSFLVPFLLASTVSCQRAHNTGICKCSSTIPGRLEQREIAQYSMYLTGYEDCPDSMISFTIVHKGNSKTICGIRDNDWVKKLKDCWDRNDMKPCRKKVTAIQPATTRPTTKGAPSTTGAPATTMSKTESTRPEIASYTEAPRRTTSSGTDLRAGNEGRSHLEPMEGTTAGTQEENDNGDANHLEQEQTPKPADKTSHLTVAVLSLLGIVFILVGIVAFLICRKKRQDHEAKYSTVNGSNPDVETVSENLNL